MYEDYFKFSALAKLTYYDTCINQFHLYSTARKYIIYPFAAVLAPKIRRSILRSQSRQERDVPKFLPAFGYNLGQIKWNIETTPPPKISDGKMARFGLHAPSSLIWGRGGISVPFYFVQDCLWAPAWRYQ